nr:hypothetical protein CFP56_20094 [Quercus suber]
MNVEMYSCNNVLVPSSVRKWIKLFGSNPFTDDNGKYVELGVIQNLGARNCALPVRFIESIQNGKWIKTYSGFNSPSQCFLCDGTEISIPLEMGKTLKVLSAIDEEYYMNRIRSFRDELIFIGMQIGSEVMHQLINNHFKCLASSAMSKKCAILLLSFIKN